MQNLYIHTCLYISVLLNTLRLGTTRQTNIIVQSKLSTKNPVRGQAYFLLI